MNCLSCGAETSNGLALCEACRIGTSVYLEFLPVYFRNLARWTPGRAGSRPVPGSRVLYSGPVDPERTGDQISDDLNETFNALTTWARALEDDRGIQPPTAETDAEQVALLCRWFATHLTTIATLEWCGEFMKSSYDGTRAGDGEPQGIGYHEAKLRVLTERAAPGWYAGRCQRVVGYDAKTRDPVKCDVPTYVVPGLTWVTCEGCGATTYARDHLEAVLDEAREHVDRPMRLAETIVALVDTEMSVPRLYERIKKWGQRAAIQAIRKLDADGDEVGPARFRLGEVLDRLRAEGETRATPKIGKAG